MLGVGSRNQSDGAMRCFRPLVLALNTTLLRRCRNWLAPTVALFPCLGKRVLHG